ncbi:MAG: glycosyl hydrolase family 18 protein, partial [Planctomycetota bacterium]
LADVMANDPYAHGVSLDLEFSWGSTVRDGITAFCAELRAALDAVDPALELSTYVGAIYQGSQWDFDAQTGITPHVDYVLYSMYDWATGQTPRAITNYGACIAPGRIFEYCDAGLPPEKLVPTISAYSRRWNGVSEYGQPGSGASSGGFTDARYDTTLRPGVGPAAYRYERGAEAAWYTWNDGVQRVRTFDSLEALQLEVRQALAADDPSGRYDGRRLGGVGFWSLMWMAETSSVDMRTGQSVSRTRTYPHVYQLVQDAFARPGDPRRDLETFAGLDFRWRDPNESPDTTGDVDGDSFRALEAAAPTATGRGRALRFGFDFEGGGVNRAVLAHEVLAHPSFPGVRDTNAVLGHVSRRSVVEATFRVDEGVPAGATLRLLVVDAAGELEASLPVPLEGVGDRVVRFPLDDPTAADPFATAEPGFGSGDGVVESSGGADIGVFGFVVELDGPGAGALVLDDVSFRRSMPLAGAYLINEIRVDDDAAEFVEIVGPAGLLPFGLQLRTFRASDGAVDRAFDLFGSIAPGGVARPGRGLYVLGDPGVPEVDQVAGFGAGSDDLPAAAPGSIQLFDAVNGVALDSVVYGGFGGVRALVREETAGVAGEGPPWIGRIGPGRDASGVPGSVGRVPDGRDTDGNGADFGALVATPGASNRVGPALPAALEFESAPTGAIVAFDFVRLVPPSLSGLPSSPGGGAAWRVVDVAGGGVVGFVGDRALGGRRGLRAELDLYVPLPLDPPQALGVGVGTGSGTTFFAVSPETSGYELGLWLVYENAPGVGLADGRPDHPGIWELLVASNDNGDADPTTLVAAADDAVLGVAPGAWTSVSIELRPAAVGPVELVVRVGGSILYAGPRPDGVPPQGALQLGFRENHPGGPAPAEGLWVDSVRVDFAAPRANAHAAPR